MTEDAMTKWGGTGAGIGCALGIIRELYFQSISQSFSMGDLLLIAGAHAFFGGLLGALLYGVISITVETAGQSNNSFIKGMIYVFVPISVFAGIDFVLFRGTYVFIPTLSLLSDGTLQGTYYSCSDWIVADEGSYCNDY